MTSLACRLLSLVAARIFPVCRIRSENQCDNDARQERGQLGARPCNVQTFSTGIASSACSTSGRYFSPFDTRYGCCASTYLICAALTIEDRSCEDYLFSTRLTRIAMNQAFMMLRRKRAVFEVLPEDPDDGKCSSELFVDQSPNPEECCWRRGRRDLLTNAINRLSPVVGRTIVLRDIEERSAEETAKILGTTISAVKTRVFHGRRKLAECVSLRLFPGVYEYGRVEA